MPKALQYPLGTYVDILLEEVGNMKQKKIIIVGGVAGGASFAARARRLDEQSQITIYERGQHVSYSNCSLPYYLGGVIEDASQLVMMNPVSFKKIYNIDVETQHEVLSIDKENKEIKVKNLKTNEIFKDSYDILLLSPGAKPIMPQSIEGIHKDHVFSVRDVHDILKLKSYIDTVEDVVVVGAGFIGLEVAENLRKSGKRVHIVEAASQALLPLDEDMAQMVHKTLLDHKVDLTLNDAVTKITDTSVILSSSQEIKADAVIMAIGVTPEISLAKDANLNIGKLGGIEVNQHYQTSDSSIYAVGDVIEETHAITMQKTRLTMAGPAQKQAKKAANHIYGRQLSNKGVIGASVLQLFDQNIAVVGMNEASLIRHNINYETAYVIAEDKVGIMPDANILHFKLLFSYPEGKVLGAQAIGKGTVDKRIDVIATAIRFGGTVSDLEDLELSYAPNFNNPKDVINNAASLALNILNGEVKQVPMSKLRGLIQEDALIIDVREMQNGKLKGTTHIPLSKLREKLSDIPKDKAVYLHCQTGVRSYNAARVLGNLGYENVINIAGSFMGIYHYEYYNTVKNIKDSIFEF